MENEQLQQTTKAYRVHEKGATNPASGHFNLPAVHYTLSVEVSFGNCPVE
jgi:hypothetical protein